jgi:preprotein translocase subunit SecG
LFPIWVVFHVIVCVALIVVVLLQSSKGEGLAGTAFSGGLSGAVFGGRGAAGFLSKATTVLAVVFMVNCGALAFMSAKVGRAAAPGAGDQSSTESAVTREAGKFQEEMATRQQAAQQKAAQDSAAKVNAAQLVPPTDTGKK